MAILQEVNLVLLLSVLLNIVMATKGKASMHVNMELCVIIQVVLEIMNMNDNHQQTLLNVIL